MLHKVLDIISEVAKVGITAAVVYDNPQMIIL